MNEDPGSDPLVARNGPGGHWPVRAWLPEILCAATAGGAAVYVAGPSILLGFPIDDAWIHMVYGLSLRTHGTFDYNEGLAGAGATSPLWAAFAALAHLVAGARGPTFVAGAVLKLFGLMAHAATAALSARLGRVAAPSETYAVPSSVACGLVVSTCPALAYAAVSGMEVPLATLILLAAFLAAFGQQTMVTAALLGLAVLTRPESVVAIPSALALSLRSGSLCFRMRRVLAALSLALGLPGLWALRNILVTGNLISSSVSLKTHRPHSFTEALASLRTAFFEMLGRNRPMERGIVWVLVLAAIVLGLRVAFRSRRGAPDEPNPRVLLGASMATTGLLYVAGVALTSRFNDPRHFYFLRYLLPPLPLFLVAAILTAGCLLSLVASRLGRRHVGGAALLLAGVLVGLWDANAWTSRRARYQADVAEIDGVQVAIGRFLASALPTDAAVWSADAGAIRYFGRRRVLDLMKLNTPDLLHGEDAPQEWAPQAFVLPLLAGFRVRSEGGPLPLVLEVPEEWAALAPPPGLTKPAPRQSVFFCPPDSTGEISIEHMGRTIAHGRCATDAPL